MCYGINKKFSVFFFRSIFRFEKLNRAVAQEQWRFWIWVDFEKTWKCWNWAKFKERDKELGFQIKTMRRTYLKFFWKLNNMYLDSVELFVLRIRIFFTAAAPLFCNSSFNSGDGRAEISGFCFTINGKLKVLEVILRFWKKFWLKKEFRESWKSWRSFHHHLNTS